MAIAFASPDAANPHFLYRTGTLPDFRSDYSFFTRIRFIQYPQAPAFASELWKLQNTAGETDYIRLIPVSSSLYRLQLRSINASASDKYDAVTGTTNISLASNYTLYVVQSGLVISVYLNGVLELQGTKDSHHTNVPDRFIMGAGRLDGTELATINTSDTSFWTVAHDSTTRSNVITNGASTETTDQWEYWSEWRHLDIVGINGRPLSRFGTSNWKTANEPQIPGVTPANLTSAAYLSISLQPGGGSIGGQITTQPTVQALTLNGAIDTSFTGLVTAAKVAGGGTLTGDPTVSAVAGQAAFVDLGISGAEAGLSFQLEFSASGLESVVSRLFAQGPEFRPSRVFVAQALNAAGQVTTGKTFTFTSSDPDVATVSTIGYYGTPLRAGTCWIVEVGPGSCTITPHCVEDGVDGAPITVTVLPAS